MADPVTVDGVEYASKRDAIRVLYERGATNVQIAEKIGSTRDAVKSALRQMRDLVRKPVLEARVLPPGIAAADCAWSEAKIEKAERLFAACVSEVALALAVPIDQLRDLWVKGTKPGISRSGSVLGVAPPAHAFEPVEGETPDRDDDEAELAALQWVDDPEATFNILLLTDADVTLEVVYGWSVEERRLAEEWAGAMHMAASDNDDIVVPPRPEFVPLRAIHVGRSVVDIVPPPSVEPLKAEEPPAPPETRFQAAPDPTPSAASPRLIPPGGIFPANQTVRLRRDDGKYLHESLEGFTDKLKYTWSGDRQRFDVVKARMPKVVAKCSMEIVVAP